MAILPTANVGGNFGFSQSVTSLSGIAAGQVIFNITDTFSSVAEINKSTSVFVCDFACTELRHSRA
jgi:hypothetical protein